jgi:hypothetical protein
MTNEAADKSDVSVEIVFGADGVNTVAKAFDAGGRELASISRVVITPHFYNAQGSVKLGSVSVNSKTEAGENEVSKVALHLSGSDGKVRAIAYTRPVKPRFLDPTPPRKKKAANPPQVPTEPPKETAKATK